jgi:hypothetical protein
VRDIGKRGTDEGTTAGKNFLHNNAFLLHGRNTKYHIIPDKKPSVIPL